MMGHRLVLVVEECEITKAEAEQVGFVDCFIYINEMMTNEDHSGGGDNDLSGDNDDDDDDDKYYSTVQRTYCNYCIMRSTRTCNDYSQFTFGIIKNSCIFANYLTTICHEKQMNIQTKQMNYSTVTSNYCNT